MPAPEADGVAAPTLMVVGFVVRPAIVTAWLASMEIAVVPLVWSANIDEVSAVTLKPFDESALMVVVIVFHP